MSHIMSRNDFSEILHSIVAFFLFEEHIQAEPMEKYIVHA